MKEFKIDNKGSGQLFSNKILERLTRTNFIVPVVLYAVVALYFLFISIQNPDISLLKNWWMIPSGVICFTLVEYLVHRFIFHFHAVTEKEMELQYNIHGVHHEFPRDKDRLVMPPVLSVVLATVFYFLFHFLFGPSGMIFFSGFLAGYSLYLVLHYAVHATKPPKNFLKFFWSHHSLHHYASVHSAFSVSFPLWDYLFGTMPDKQERARVGKKLPDTI